MGAREAVFELVCCVPAGKVATYGQVAELVTARVGPRDVGRIMFAAPEGVPWWRVVGAGGTLPIARRSPGLADRQRNHLLEEGVTFLRSGAINMEACQWDPSDEDLPDEPHLPGDGRQASAPSRWTFAQFDWTRFEAFEEGLKEGVQVGTFADPRLARAAARLVEAERGAPIQSICNSLIVDFCCDGEPVEFGSNLPDLVVRLRRRLGGRALDPLADFAFGTLNIQEWFGCGTGLVSILTVAETQALAHLLAEIRPALAVRPRRGAVDRIKRAVTGTEAGERRFLELVDLVTQASEARSGLAVVVD